MHSEAAKWLEFAETDIGVARHLFNSYHPKPLEIICYHCQQAAEKAIKAVILQDDIPGGLPKKHDLSFLMSQVKNAHAIPDEYYDCADTLSQYGVMARYPNELFIEEKNATQAIHYAEIILGWAKSCVE